jgi:hypothetical protein
MTNLEATVVSLLPHLYTLLMTMLDPWQIKAFQRQLEAINIEPKPSSDWIAKVVFENMMGDLVRLPLVTILATVVVTLQVGSLALTAICVFLAVALYRVVSVIKDTWTPYDLNRQLPFLWWQLKGQNIILLIKFVIIGVSGIIVALSRSIP